MLTELNSIKLKLSRVDNFMVDFRDRAWFASPSATFNITLYSLCKIKGLKGTLPKFRGPTCQNCITKTNTILYIHITKDIYGANPSSMHRQAPHEQSVSFWRGSDDWYLLFITDCEQEFHPMNKDKLKWWCKNELNTFLLRFIYLRHTVCYSNFTHSVK